MNIDKERLESVKNAYKHDKLIYTDLKWLIEQAEKVQEIENRYDEQLEESQKTYDYFKDQNKKIHEAIEQINNLAKVQPSHPTFQLITKLTNTLLEELK